MRIQLGLNTLAVRTSSFNCCALFVSFSPEISGSIALYSNNRRGLYYSTLDLLRNRFLAVDPRVDKMIRTALRGLTRLPISSGRARPAQWYRLAQTQQQEQVDADSQLPPTIEELKKIDPAFGTVGRAWNYDLELSALAQRLGYKLSQLPSLQMALTHISVIAGNVCLPNDRLVSLGSAASSHYVSEFLYHTYPNMNGVSIRDVVEFLTEQKLLTSISKHLGIADLLLHTAKLESPEHSDIFSEAFLAVLGALQVDQGPMAVRKIIYNVLIPQLKNEDLSEIIKFKHPRFMLSTVLKIKGMPSPNVHLLKESGRATHFPTFMMGVYSGKKLLAEGFGSSKRRAEEEAMNAALRLHFLQETRNAKLPFDYEDYLPDSAIELGKELNPDADEKEAN